MWENIANNDEIYYILSHPNGWEGAEQSLMRQAAIRANLIPDTDAGHTRVMFISEGEASLHFVIENGTLEVTGEVWHFKPFLPITDIPARMMV